MGDRLVGCYCVFHQCEEFIVRNLVIPVIITGTVLALGLPATAMPENSTSKEVSSNNDESSEEFGKPSESEFIFGSNSESFQIEPLGQQNPSETPTFFTQATDAEFLETNATSPEDFQQLLEDLTPLADVPTRSRPTPGITFGTPTAYGISWGQAYFTVSSTIGLAGGQRTADGSFATGIGFGDPLDSVGLEVAVSLTSSDPQDLADSGSVGFKLHKIIPNTEGLALAVGWDNAIPWGDVVDTPNTIYGVASKTFALRPESDNQLPLSVSLGLGSGSFRTLTESRDFGPSNSPKVFGSLGLVINPTVSFATSWTGNQLNLGIGLAPFRAPLTFTMGLTDVTNNTGNRLNFNINAGYALSW
ncbi:hypothetical protein [Picosynechococcus sp. NKBG15041c]|uniref:hypothetical protein n=1 Tax=Picosynechococcus sp. NKBG15041c TaxID=1407650 RepID=UPI0003F4ED39|nr:hypothetical protein [Picosynechococcus sp. NKBG15041c]